MERRLERVVGEVEAAGRSAASVVDLCRAVHAAVQRVVPSDRWCGFATDPATVFATNGYHDEGLDHALIPRMLEIEYGDGDVNDFSTLARSPSGVATIGAATGGDPARSARWREVIVPSGLAHELRAVFRDRDGAWAGLVLLRASDCEDFTPREAALVAGIGAAASAAFRRALLRQHLDSAQEVREAGILVLGADRLETRSISPAARRWIDELDDGGLNGLPTPVVSVTRAAAAGRSSVPAAVRTRTRRGRWLTITAEPLAAVEGGSREVGLVLQPSRPAEIALIVAAAHGLSARESEIARLVAAGQTNQQIALALGVSPYTVADHLKHVFRKLDVSTRGELTSRLFFDHCLPHALAGRAAGVDGWFVG